MSLHEYTMSEELQKKDYPFYSLIMAAMRRADDVNLVRLQTGWPEVWKELQARYNAPGGILMEQGEAMPDPDDEHEFICPECGCWTR